LFSHADMLICLCESYQRKIVFDLRKTPVIYQDQLKFLIVEIELEVLK